MLEIARALQDQEGAHDGILALDEPTAALPPHEVEVLLAALKRYVAVGQSVLFESHRLDEVLEISDRVTILRDGKVVGTRSAEGSRGTSWSS
jgi:ribose transport system ATP-binding protein